MDFGPFGLAEVVFIGLLALVLFGPRRLPEFARSVGSVMTALRRGSEELKRNFQDELDAAGDPTKEIRKTAEQLRAATEDLKGVGRDIVAEGKRRVGLGESVARPGVSTRNSQTGPGSEGDER